VTAHRFAAQIILPVSFPQLFFCFSLNFSRLFSFANAKNPIFDYSIHPKAGQSGIRMVISRTLFVCGYLMEKTRWRIPFESRTGYFSLA
jgi:hypothetical protein